MVRSRADTYGCRSARQYAASAPSTSITVAPIDRVGQPTSGIRAGRRRRLTRRPQASRHADSRDRSQIAWRRRARRSGRRATTGRSALRKCCVAPVRRECPTTRALSSSAFNTVTAPNPPGIDSAAILRASRRRDAPATAGQSRPTTWWRSRPVSGDERPPALSGWRNETSRRTRCFRSAGPCGRSSRHRLGACKRARVNGVVGDQPSRQIPQGVNGLGRIASSGCLVHRPGTRRECADIRRSFVTRQDLSNAFQRRAATSASAGQIERHPHRSPIGSTPTRDLAAAVIASSPPGSWNRSGRKRISVSRIEAGSASLQLLGRVDKASAPRRRSPRRRHVVQASEHGRIIQLEFAAQLRPATAPGIRHAGVRHSRPAPRPELPSMSRPSDVNRVNAFSHHGSSAYRAANCAAVNGMRPRIPRRQIAKRIAHRLQE